MNDEFPDATSDSFFDPDTGQALDFELNDLIDMDLEFEDPQFNHSPDNPIPDEEPFEISTEQITRTDIQSDLSNSRPNMPSSPSTGSKALASMTNTSKVYRRICDILNKSSIKSSELNNIIQWMIENTGLPQFLPEKNSEQRKIKRRLKYYLLQYMERYQHGLNAFLNNLNNRNGLALFAYQRI